MMTYDVPPVPPVGETPMDEPYEPSVVLTDLILEMEPERVTALREACTPPASGLGPWLDEQVEPQTEDMGV